MKHSLLITLCVLGLSQYGIADEMRSYPTASYPSASYFSESYPYAYGMSSNGVYVKGFGGFNGTVRPNWNHAKYHTTGGYVVGGAIGGKIHSLYLEGEVSYRNNTINRLKVDAFDIDASGHIEQWCVFGNLLADIPISTWLNPYVGGGLGYRHLKPGANFDESNDISFDNFISTRNQWGVYQIIAGFKFLPIRHFNLLAEYRFMSGWANERCSNHSACASAVCCF